MDGRRQQAMDWQAFQQSMFEKMPYVGNHMQGTGIGNFVNKAIKQYMPNGMPLQSALHSILPAALDYELFETHRSIFVRCRLPEGTLPSQVKFYANRRMLKVEHGGKTEEIPLPSDVSPSRTVARHYAGVLEIRMPKTGESEPFQEIFVRGGGK